MRGNKSKEGLIQHKEIIFSLRSNAQTLLSEVVQTLHCRSVFHSNKIYHPEERKKQFVDF